MGRREEPAWAMGTLGLTVARERGDITRQFQNRLTVTRSTIDRLGLEKELHGHMGCVNCLEWNYDGSILASASDDLHVILWDPYSYKQLNSIPTGHTGNIFSVKFVSPEVIATCAADGAVRTRNVTTGAALLECVCHCGRVKRLASAPHNPSLMWSAGEDGLVLQHDMRAAHRCNSESANVVVNLLNHMGRYAEAKCVAVNPRRPYQLAVGANDFYVRLYDIRMIKLGRLQSCVSPTSGWGAGAARGRQLWERQNVRCARAGIGDPDNNIPKHAACYYAPGHLSIETSQQVLPKKTTTYVAFSQDGNELLVNLGSEQVYIYDLNSARQPVLVESYIIQHNHGCREEDKTQKRPQVNIPGSNGTSTPNGTNGTVDQLPESARQLKEVANSLVGAGNYCGAVEVYNAAIARAPHAALLYSNRAAALMRRGWAGDTYAAIKDCYCAIKLDPLHVKSHFRLAKGLMDLKRAREAHECLLYFKDKFPKHANSHAVFLLQKDINLALEDMETEPDEVGGAGGGGAGGGGGGAGGAGGAPPTEGVEWGALSVLERQLRVAALDYKQRYLGHCNTTTDIKEANFLGPDASYLAAGSDDGSLFIWCRASGNIVRCLRGDESIVNCVQLHPSAFLLATSGIETAVRLWSPRPEDGRPEPRLVRDAAAAASANQQRMQSDPFEAMLLNISFTGERDLHPPACRPV